MLKYVANTCKEKFPFSFGTDTCFSKILYFHFILVAMIGFLALISVLFGKKGTDFIVAYGNYSSKDVVVYVSLSLFDFTPLSTLIIAKTTTLYD